MSAGRLQLEILEGDRVTDTRAFAGTVIEIGKLSKSDLQITDENISRRHAKIEIDADGKVHVIDLDSTNGTKLNGMRITKAAVADGDEIEIGLTRLRVRFDAELKKANQKAAPAAGRAGLSGDSFYRTQDDAKRGGRFALEGALLWDGAPVQADSFERQTLSPRMKGFISLLWAFCPLTIGVLAVVANLMGFPTVALGVGCIAIGLFVNFMMDIEAWKTLVADSLHSLSRGESIYLGETTGSRFFVPSEAIGAKEHALIVPHKSGWALDLRLESLRGDVLIDGKVISLDDPAAKAQLMKGGLLPVTPGSKCRLRFGKFSMLLGYVNVPSRVKGGGFNTNSIQEFAYLALSLILHFSVLILFVYMQPEDEIQIRRPRNQLIAKLITVESIKHKEREEKKKREEEEELPEKVDLKEEEKVVLEDAAPTPTVTETEKLVEAEKPKNSPDMAERRRDQGPKVPMTEEQKKARQEQTSRVAKATAERYIPTDMLANVTGRDLLAGKPGQGLNIRVVSGGPGVAGDGGPNAGNSAMGTHAGGENTGGYAGMDFGGTGGPNGTDGSGLNGGGGPIVAGLDRTAGGGTERLKAAGLQAKELKAIVTTAGEVTSSGGLTKKIIQQYMDRQKGAIIACYKKEVQKTPNLEGKVVVAFTISPTGKVMGPGIKTSTLGNSAVESCIVGRLGIFRFPAPENAGAVKVTYPFLFRTR